MIVVPPTAVSIALIGLGLAPLLIAILGRAPFKIAAEGRRFLVTSASIFVGWAIVSFAFNGWEVPDPMDAAAAIMLLVGGTVAYFTIWSILVWGFTVSVLRCLAERNGALTREEWIDLYTEGSGIARFSNDRLSVLTGFHLATVGSDDLVRLTPRGRLVGRLSHWARTLFGLSS